MQQYRCWTILPCTIPTHSRVLDSCNEDARLYFHSNDMYDAHPLLDNQTGLIACGSHTIPMSNFISQPNPSQTQCSQTLLFNSISNIEFKTRLVHYCSHSKCWNDHENRSWRNNTAANKRKWSTTSSYSSFVGTCHGHGGSTNIPRGTGYHWTLDR